jgi:PHP family Zn ribbon phosphoesterase
MSPLRLVAEAARRGLDIIAVTDHNSAGNAGAAIRAAVGTRVVVLPGLEICTREEVHVLAVFETAAAAEDLQEEVFRNLSGTNDPDAFGVQVVANEHDEVERIEERLLIGATDLSVEETTHSIHRRGGLAIAAHFDRESFGVVGQLGFIPAGLDFDALELSPVLEEREAETVFGEYRHFAWLRSSDAHMLEHVGTSITRLLLAEPSFAELRLALHRQQGRAVALKKE